MSYTLEAKATTSSDGRFGRCWIHVSEPTLDDLDSPERVFAVEWLLNRQLKDQELTQEEAMALALSQAAQWLRGHIENLDIGKAYHITVTADGPQEPRVEQLPD